MSRDLDKNSYYVSHGGLIPIKWTAPEVRNSILINLIELYIFESEFDV